MQVTVPVRFETIEVRYLVNDDLHWWPAVVEDVSVTGNGENRRSSGVLMFQKNDELGYDKERVSVDFYNGNMLREHRKPHHDDRPEATTWRTAVEDDQEDGEYEDFMTVRSRRNPRRGTRGAEHVQSNRTRRTRQSVGRRASARVQSRHVTTRRVDAEEDAMEALQEELRSTRRELDHLYRNFNTFRNHVTAQLSNTCNSEASHVIRATKLYLKRVLLQEFQRPPKKPSIQTDSEFTSVLRRTVVRCRIPCDLKLFQALADDVSKTTTSGQDADVMFLPSQAHIATAPHGMPQGKVIFREFTSLLRWLGLRDPEDREKISYRTVCNETYQAIRMVAGSQWNTDVLSGSMKIFPGMSCAQGPVDVDGSAEKDRSPCLYRPSARWDETNGAFVHSLEVKSSNSGFSSIEKVQDDTSSAICLMWCYRDGLSRNVWSVDATSSAEVTLGDVEIALPVVFTYGMRLCGEVERNMESL